MKKIIFYSTHCSKCDVLEAKLRSKNITFEEVNDVKAIRKKGFLSAPLLDVDGKIMGFKEAIDWVNEYVED